MPDPASGVSVVIDDETEDVRVDPVTGTIEHDQPDGGVMVNLDARRPRKDDAEGNEWFENLADDIDEMQLGIIANELIDAIEADDRSRHGYLATRARGLDLLGLKLETAGASLGDASASMEGLSKVTNPLLLEALLKGWANAQAELLPAEGPLKVTVDGEESPQEDDLAEALERDMNHWFTKTAHEYYPDTSHMLLWGTYFGGSGIKKVYRCPMRRRPVSESVDVKDLIVSDTTKDLRSCSRITHAIAMRPSVMRRMQMIDAYRKVTLTQPMPMPNAVDAKIAGIQGTQPVSQRPEDQPYNLYETQCELDLDQFIPEGSQFKGEGIPLPYCVTLDKDSREILAIRRDWNTDDEHCERRRMYVRYPYVPGPGFYGTGLLNILGNASAAMTAAWRVSIDNGMLANFPGGLIAKTGTRQNSTRFAVGLGEFLPIEINGQPIQQMVMPMPYREVGANFLALIDKITAQAQAVGGVADIPTAEGIQNVPVGTMLAQIEQSTKVMAAAHKGMHTAQSEEFDLIINLFRENPKDFWESNKVVPRDFWTEEKFLQAINDYHLVPRSDPNVPSHIHRVAKSLALIQLVPIFPGLMDPKETLMRVLRVLREDPTGLVMDPQPQQAPPDPKAIEAQAKVMKAQADAALAQGKLAQLPQEQQLQTAKLATQRDIAATDLQKEYIIHQGDQAKAAHDMAMERHSRSLETVKTVADIAQRAREHSLSESEHHLDHSTAAHDAVMREHEHALNVHEVQHPPQPAKPKPKT